MKLMNHIQDEEVASPEQAVDSDPLLPLVQGRATTSSAGHSFSGAVVGELIGIDREGGLPLVAYPGQPGAAAVMAQTVVELNAAHVGSRVVLMFDGGDASAPIIMGVLQDSHPQALERKAAPVAVDVDGDRVLVTGERQLVLRCGNASITLTREGKVLIHGTYLSSHSSGVNRIKGGSVEIN
jgi:hypothetical protein